MYKIKSMLRGLEIPNDAIGGLKIVYDNDLVIYNYQNLLDITKDKIVMDNLCVTGEELKVLFLDKHAIKVHGNIKNIMIGMMKDDLL